MALRGTPVLRREDLALLTTGGMFVGDRKLANCAHVAYVTSPVAHAVLRSIDTSDAVAAPGVLGVFTHADLDGLGPVPLAQPRHRPRHGPAVAVHRHGPLRRRGDRRRRGARPGHQAIDAVDLVVIDFEPLPVLVDPEVALASDLKLFDGAASNVALHLDAPDAGPGLGRLRGGRPRFG